MAAALVDVVGEFHDVADDRVDLLQIANLPLLLQVELSDHSVEDGDQPVVVDGRGPTGHPWRRPGAWDRESNVVQEVTHALHVVVQPGEMVQGPMIVLHFSDVLIRPFERPDNLVFHAINRSYFF